MSSRSCKKLDITCHFEQVLPPECRLPRFRTKGCHPFGAFDVVPPLLHPRTGLQGKCSPLAGGQSRAEEKLAGGREGKLRSSKKPCGFLSLGGLKTLVFAAKTILLVQCLSLVKPGLRLLGENIRTCLLIVAGAIFSQKFVGRLTLGPKT